jgi:signal peptidase I
LPNGVSYNTLDLTDNGFYDNTQVYVVPPDHYFMMGDNRDNSEDSRYWGFMPRSYAKGEALFIYFSMPDDAPLSHFLTAVRWGRLLHRVH